MAHIPVLLDEVLQYLDPKPGDNFVDCTVGEGGHALAILKLTAPNGLLLGIDRDADMIANLWVKAEQSEVSERLLLHRGNFTELSEIAQAHKFEPVRGVVFDFGLSSWQLEESGAGFSFQNIEPLDMRFDRTEDCETAASILNSWPEESISRILWEFGEEKYARKIAETIVSARKKQRIETTDQLVEIISMAITKKGFGGIHFATRTFQALRIAVNSELENIEIGLKEAISLLSPGGRIAAISFHSLEDRRVKNIFREYSKRVEGGPPSPRRSVGATEGQGSLKIITKKPISPSADEVSWNPRSRSAKLRVAEKN